MLESFIESVKKTSIKGRRLISEGKIMKIYEPTKSVGYTIGPVPKTVASGKINQSYFAWGNLGINFGTLDISSTGFLNIFKDSIITIDISITVTQTGDLAPEAHIIAKFYRNYTDIELGVISSNKVAESGAIYITGANQRGYYFMTMGGEEHYISDKDGWLEKLVERIEMEWYT